MSKEIREIYEFGTYQLDVIERTLVDLPSGRRLSLPDKAFQTLVALVKNNGHLMTKKELLDIVWPDSFVEENNLDKAVHAIRSALGENQNVNKYVETVRKHGYRFVPEVRRVNANISADGRELKSPDVLISSPTARVTASGQHALVDLHDWQSLLDQLDGKNGSRQAAVEKVGPNGSKAAEPDLVHEVPFGFETDDQLTEVLTDLELARKKRPLFNGLLSAKHIRISAAALAIVAMIFVGLSYYISLKPGFENAKIAVLPFKPIKSSDRNELYELGMAHSVINQLVAAKGLVVRPWYATRKYADLEQDPVAAGREQQVEYVLASNYQLADGKIRITAELYKVATGQIEETYSSESDTGDYFAMQDAVAGVLANRMLARFAPNQSDRTTKRGTANVEAYRLYLQGKNLTDKRNQADVRKAIAYFEQASQLDPNFALAFIGMSEAHAATGSLLRGDARAAYANALPAIQKAFELDPNSADAYAVRGGLKTLYEWDFAGAEKDLLRAIELEPSNNLAQRNYARLLNHLGRFDEALDRIEIALEIDPNSLVDQRERGRFSYFSRRFDEAIVHLERLLEIDESFITVYGWLWRSYELKGEHAAAFRWFIRHQKLVYPDRADDYQIAYETGGWQNLRRKLLEFEKLEEPASGNYYQIAAQLASLNEKEEAFAYLNKAVEKRQTQLSMLKVEPLFDSLRGDPRFEQMLKKIGF